MTCKRLLMIITSVLVLGGLMMIFSLNGEKQRSKEEEMIAIATSDEAKKVYEDYLKQEDLYAFLEDGFVQSYEIDLNNLDYNPMGGLMVHIFVNHDRDKIVGFNLIDNGDGTYHSAYYTSSPDFWKSLDDYYGR